MARVTVCIYLQHEPRNQTRSPRGRQEARSGLEGIVICIQ